jgi:hypothetical protein
VTLHSRSFPIECVVWDVPKFGLGAFEAALDSRADSGRSEGTGEQGETLRVHCECNNEVERSVRGRRDRFEDINRTRGGEVGGEAPQRVWLGEGALGAGETLLR